MGQYKDYSGNTSMHTCNLNYISNYAIVEGRQVSIDDFVNGIFELTHVPRCIPHGHELTPVINVTKKRPHFRHKHTEDMDNHPMTEWHAEWQSHFQEHEIPFTNRAGQRKDRRADIVVSKFSRIIEIQHSLIDASEVTNRNHDYALHGHNVLWIVDGNDRIQIKRLGNRIILDFSALSWLYERFLECDSVYYDIDGFIYTIRPGRVRSHQVDVCEPMRKCTFIEALKTQEHPWIPEEVPQSFLYVKQSGAGSGKTYGIFQRVHSDPEFISQKWFIFITKQHSAVNVMYSECMDQYTGGKMPNIELIGDSEYENKKYIVHFRFRDTGNEACAVFATVDSFTYAVGVASTHASDQFMSIVRSIKDGVSKVKHCGKLKFAGVDPFMNKETCIWIDETQDLSELYGEAFLTFVTSNHITLCVVGDRLQSLTFRENALTFLHRASYAGLKVVREDVNNVVRRFSDPRLIRFVNSIVPFETYDLPLMTAAHTVEELSGALTIFSGKGVYADQSQEDKNVVCEVEQIMGYFRNEVEQMNRIPEDFMIVTPFTKNNPLVDALQIAIHMFWKDKMENDDSYITKVKSSHPYWKHTMPGKYTRYAIFHKSEEMGSINLDDSKHATRMVSIHSSKGDGRKVVFVIGVSQSALQVFSQITGNAIYDSLLHVAITRQKERLYFRLEVNNDDIHQRISTSTEEICSTNTDFDFAKDTIKLPHISNDLQMFSYDDMYINIIRKYTHISKQIETKSEEKRLIDMGDHNIRYASMLMNIIVHACNYQQRTPQPTKMQFYAILGNLKMERIKLVSGWKDYVKILEKNSKNIKLQMSVNNIIPIIQFRSRGDGEEYARYCKVILSTMDRIITELTSIGKRQMHYFCPLECVILYYMLECMEKGKHQDITISDVYTIIDIYSKAFDSSARGHDYCICKSHFADDLSEKTDLQRKHQEYIRNHYDQMSQIWATLDIFMAEHPKVNWLYQLGVKFSGGLENDNKDFSIHTGYPLLCYDDANVYVFTLKPQFNDLNFNEVMVKSICDTWMCMNVNNIKFIDKSIVSCVLSLNKEELYIVDWTHIVYENIDSLTNGIYDMLYKRFSIKHEQYYKTFVCILAKNPVGSIDECMKQVKKKGAPYIVNFWKYIEGQILESSGKKEKQEILTKYSNKETFVNTLDRYLRRSLFGYLGMIEEEE